MQSLSRNEAKQRGSVDFPLEYYFLDRKHPRFFMQLHWHVENELIRVRKGHFRVSLDGNQYDMKEGDVCFVGDGVLHEGTSDDAECEYECIVFSMELLRHRNYRDDIFLSRVVHHSLYINPIIRKEEQGDILPGMFDSMLKVLRNGEETAPQFTCAVLKYFFSRIERAGLFREEPFASTYGSKRSMQIKKALDLIETSYNEPITLDDLAAAAGLSSKYFCGFFREMTEKTPIEYLNIFRIERACHMMLTTELSLIEIAMECGFNDYNYFIRMFRKIKGVTPHRYIKLARGNLQVS